MQLKLPPKASQRNRRNRRQASGRFGTEVPERSFAAEPGFREKRQAIGRADAEGGQHHRQSLHHVRGGEGIEKKVDDFAAEVAAQMAASQGA
jgi:translation elongation factor EF-Ts